VGERVAFRMPSLGADMVAGTVLAWHVGPGDRVAVGDLVALVDTEKAEIDIETFEAGVVGELVVPVGERVPVGTVIAYLDEVGDAASTGAAVPAPPAPAAVVPVPAAAEPHAEPHAEPRVVSPLVRHLAEARHLDAASLSGSGPGHRVMRRDLEADGRRAVSPRARRLAAAAGLEVGALAGTGPGGAVVGADVEAAVASAATGPSLPAAPPVPSGTVPSPPAPGAPGTRRDPTRMRQAVAELMSRSWREIPHYHLSTRADVSVMMQWLADANEARPISERLLPAAVLLRATALAATRHPQLNGWWVDDGFRAAERVDLGTVVSLRGGGLLAPTIADAGAKPLDAVMRDLRDLVGRARRGRLRSGDTIPASITVTNLGELGVDAVFGVIHPPQVALVGFGAVHEEAWAHQGMVAARPVLHITLAGDHRASDGLTGAAFLSDLVTLLQDPEHL